MSEKKSNQRSTFSPFLTRMNYEGQKDFDKYYYEISEKEVFRDSGEVDPDTGDRLGVVEKKFVVKKIDIAEYLQSQAESVGVESYIRSLSLQGENIEDYHTEVDMEHVVDYSQMPDTLADVLTAGDRAKQAFANLDPALKGSHTTIEGFLNGLSKEVVDSYLKSKLEALSPKQAEGGNE